MGPKPKLFGCLYWVDRISAVKITLIYVPHNLASYNTFIITRPVRSMGIVLMVISLSTSELSYPLVVMGDTIFIPCLTTPYYGGSMFQTGYFPL